ncbi:MAG: hypothetical protein GXW85_12685 [Clostridia bacterium]|nr:hypothetical protein [Clostridia bacterium]
MGIPGFAVSRFLSTRGCSKTWGLAFFPALGRFFSRWAFFFLASLLDIIPLMMAQRKKIIPIISISRVTPPFQS